MSWVSLFRIGGAVTEIYDNCRTFFYCFVYYRSVVFVIKHNDFSKHLGKVEFNTALGWCPMFCVSALGVGYQSSMGYLGAVQCWSESQILSSTSIK
jgi:hypothetical protein